MKTGIADWLRTDAPPRNLYELLGHPLLDPDREAVLRGLRAANRALLDYQSHPEPAVANRAMGLLTELGWARGILEDAARWLAYTEELAATVRKEFVADRGIDALVAGTGLADWLASRYGVGGGDLYRVVQAVGWKPQSTPQPVAPPPAEPPKSTPPKFGVFNAPTAAPPASPPLPLSLDDTAGNTDDGRAARIPAGPRGVYSLDEAERPPVRPKPSPARHAGRAPKAKRPAEQVSPPTERGDWLPLLVAGAVILAAGLAAIAYLATREPRTRAVQATTEPAEITSPDRTQLPDARPPTEPTPTAEPPIPTLPTTEPTPTAQPVRPAPKAEAPIPPPTVSEPPPPPATLPNGIEGLPRATSGKRNPFRGDPAGPQTREPEPAQLPGLPPAGPARARPPAPDKGGWVKVGGGEGTWRVGGVEARVESAGVERLTLIDDSGARRESAPVLVIWVKVRNTGTGERKYRKWMNFAVRRAETYDYCQLTAGGKKVGKPAWFAPTTKIEEMPTWSDDLSSDRFIAPGGTALVPLVFAVPPADAKGLVLTLKAVRLTDYDGGLDLVRADDKYGAFTLRIPESGWTK